MIRRWVHKSPIDEGYSED